MAGVRGNVAPCPQKTDTGRIMPDGNVDLIRGLYGFNWADIDERERGLEVSRGATSADVQARVSPEVGDRTLHGLEGFAVFVEGLEEDFSDFRYEAERIEELSDEQVLVAGHIQARGRRSNMPLSAPFGHVWTVRQGKAVKVEARLAPAP
jgi:hypothetical protein